MSAWGHERIGRSVAALKSGPYFAEDDIAVGIFNENHQIAGKSTLRVQKFDANQNAYANFA